MKDQEVCSLFFFFSSVCDSARSLFKKLPFHIWTPFFCSSALVSASSSRFLWLLCFCFFWNMRSLFFVVVWLQVWVAVTGYPTGAPVGKCVDMTPGHGVPGQTGPSPYTIKLNSSTFSQQQPVSVTIQGPPYVGLLLQARSGSSTNAVGTWGPPPANTKHLECSGPQSAITHDNRNPKNNETTYIWIPSNSLNTAVVRATVVANRTMFWVNMASAQLSVVPGGGSNAVADPKMAVVFLTLLMSLLLQ